MGRNVEEKLSSDEIEAPEEGGEEKLSFLKKVWNENKLMWRVAAPGMFTRFSTFGIFENNCAAVCKFQLDSSP